MGKRLYNLLLWVVRLLGVILALYVGLYIYAQQVEYTPYQVKGYEAVPDEICPGGAIRVELTRYVNPEGNVESIETRTSWRNEQGLSTGVTEYVSRWGEEGPPNGYGLKTVNSSILREVPSESGEYTIVSEYIVRGSVLGFERVDRYVVTEDDSTLTVLDPSSERCMGFS